MRLSCACGLSVAFCGDLGCDHGHALSGNMDGDVSRDGPNKCGQEVVLAIRLFITWLWNACLSTCYCAWRISPRTHRVRRPPGMHRGSGSRARVCVLPHVLQLRGPVLASSFLLLLGRGRGVGDTDMESRAQRQNSPCGASETPRFARTGSGAVKDAAKKLSENLEHGVRQRGSRAETLCHVQRHRTAVVDRYTSHVIFLMQFAQFISCIPHCMAQVSVCARHSIFMSSMMNV